MPGRHWQWQGDIVRFQGSSDNIRETVFNVQIRVTMSKNSRKTVLNVRETVAMSG